MGIKSEALQSVEKELQEKVKEATNYMKNRVNASCDKGFATGALEGSIHTERTGKWSWRIGSSLDYASYVNDGRGIVRPKNKPALYLKGLNFWMPRGMPVGPADAKHFIEDTKTWIEG